jgi:hypothetical protein
MNRSAFWQRVAGLALALGLLAGCSPPPELENRPATPPDVAAASLMPPGRLDRTVPSGATDAAAATTADGRLAAMRFASTRDAQREFARLRDNRLARSDVTSSTKVDAGPILYARYATADAAALMWVSATWVFVAECRDRAALQALIASSGAGGLEAPGFLGSAAGLTIVFGGAFVVLLLAIVLLLHAVLRAIAVGPAPGVAAIATVELVRRLTALNGPDRPWLVRSGSEADLVVEWKYADATWWGLLAKSGVRKAYRLRLYFDETARRCGALDEFGEVDWSAGLLAAPRIHYSRKFFRGVQLVRKERGVAYGFATPTGGLAKVLDYKFDIDELKQPVIDVVTGSGWTYQPILWPRRERPPTNRAPD